MSNASMFNPTDITSDTMQHWIFVFANDSMLTHLQTINNIMIGAGYDLQKECI
jgi:hypothetical protein